MPWTPLVTYHLEKRVVKHGRSQGGDPRIVKMGEARVGMEPISIHTQLAISKVVQQHDKHANLKAYATASDSLDSIASPALFLAQSWPYLCTTQDMIGTSEWHEGGQHQLV